MTSSWPRNHLIPVMVTLAILLTIYRPILSLAWDAFEARGYAKMNGLSMNLAWRLLHYSLAWAVAGAAAITLTWSLL